MKSIARIAVLIGAATLLPACKHSHAPVVSTGISAAVSNPPASQPAPHATDLDDTPTTMPTTAAIEPRDAGPGPTRLAKVAGGYELRNRAVRLVIDEKTGDVNWFGPVDGSRNLLLRRGAWVNVAGNGDTPPDGYVEMRDEQTWQYLGDDANGVRWRKIYSLDGHSVFASYVVQNLRATPMDVTIRLSGDFATFRITSRDVDSITGQTAFGGVTVRGFNEFHPNVKPQELPTLIESDRHALKPQERISFTTEWVFVEGK